MSKLAFYVVPRETETCPPPGSLTPGQARLFQRLCEVRAREAVQSQRLAEQRALDDLRLAAARHAVRVAWSRAIVVGLWLAALVVTLTWLHYS